jgi:putative FmdB family regulatory protein
MDVPYFTCEDCGHEFEKTEFLPDIEDALVSCPVCGGWDIQLVQEPVKDDRSQAA